MNLIDRDKLMDALNVFSDREHADPKWMSCLESVKEIVTFMPTVDAAVKTYCKDCKYYQYDKLENRAYCAHFVTTDPDKIYHCGYAERKEE